MARSGRKASWIGIALMTYGILTAALWLLLPAGEKSRLLSATNPPYKPGTVLVRFAQSVDRQKAEHILQGIKAQKTGTIFGSDVDILRVAEGQEKEIIAYLSAQPDVIFAEPDYLYSVAAAPDDPFFGAQWAHTNLHSVQAWDITTGSTSIKIAIVDTGIDAGHPDLATKILPGHSFLNQGIEDSNPVDLHGHGTHVSGIAAAMTNNLAGVAGTSWGAKIIPIRSLGTDGKGWTTDIAAGINWARLNGADIINLSLGGDAQSSAMATAVQQAYDAGILVVAAMGNYATDTPFYPAAYPHVLAVAGTKKDNTRATYSNFGSHADISAPGGYLNYLHDGDGILSTMPTYNVTLTTDELYSKYYDTLHGTSQAAPFISGLAALIWSMDPTLSPDAVTDIITSTAVDLGSAGWDPYYGHGLADAKAALDVVNGLDVAPVMAAISNPDQDGNYNVVWTSVDRATFYNLEISSAPGFGSPSLVYSGTNLIYAVTGQPAGIWYFRVKAVNHSDDSPWSNIEQTGVLPGAPVLQPISTDG
ncbi:MAG: S8 family serine peptidase, partial [Anaerolineae bacterium]|nr:S8 family serine peptidase [Anaerolineae bacterium]